MGKKDNFIYIKRKIKIMCGIGAIIGKTTNQEIKKLLNPVVHRGEKNFEIEVFASMGLGTNRLPIVDGKNGKQPKFNEDKTICAVMNGEIFNYKDLRNRLENKGHKIETNNDTEILPHLYEEYGEKFVEHIDSEMFSIIIFDVAKDNFVVARDPLGVKPLYFSKVKGKLIFASEAKQLTQFKNISKIKIFPPGNTFNGKKFKKYYELPNKLTDQSKKEEISKVYKLLEESVKKRIPFKLKLGILLSGGLDSSAILTIAKKYTDNIEAFIVGTNNSIDLKYAVSLCKKLKINYKIIIPQNPKLKDLDNLVKITETNELNTIMHSWVAYLACKEMKKNKIKVALTGEGADELFGGYSEFKKISIEKNHKARKLLTEDLHLTQLPRLDRTSMAFTIEMRSPFLDTGLVNKALKLEDSNYGEHSTKGILKEALKDILPIEIIKREKMPFSSGAGIFVGDKEFPEENVFLNLKQGNKKINLKKYVNKIYNSLLFNKIVAERAINKENLISHI
jgi:asparagine synthase (glutamine-hydrolysing)